MGDSAQGGQERGAHDRVLFHHCGEVGGTRKGVFVKQKKKKETGRAIVIREWPYIRAPYH